MSVREERSRLVRFVVVGCTAAAVHWSVVRLLVDGAGMAPLPANLPAWLIAFGVSFAGHHHWTFGDVAGRTVSRSLPRFLMVSLCGFAVNQTAYAIALAWGGWRYDLTLAAVLVLVAVGTFVAGRLWAFRAA